MKEVHSCLHPPAPVAPPAWAPLPWRPCPWRPCSRRAQRCRHRPACLQPPWQLCPWRAQRHQRPQNARASSACPRQAWTLRRLRAWAPRQAALGLACVASSQRPQSHQALQPCACHSHVLRRFDGGRMLTNWPLSRRLWQGKSASADRHGAHQRPLLPGTLRQLPSSGRIHLRLEAPLGP